MSSSRPFIPRSWEKFCDSWNYVFLARSGLLMPYGLANGGRVVGHERSDIVNHRTWTEVVT